MIRQSARCRRDRRPFPPGVVAGLAAGGAPRTAQAGPALPDTSQSPLPLAALAFKPLPLGAIRAQGWLGRQLRIQADGLSGHLDEFWPDIAESQWFGGRAEGWERAPHWLAGAGPPARPFVR